MFKRALGRAKFMGDIKRMSSFVQANQRKKKDLRFTLSLWDCMKFYIPWAHSPKILLAREVNFMVIN